MIEKKNIDDYLEYITDVVKNCGFDVDVNIIEDHSRQLSEKIDNIGRNVNELLVLFEHLQIYYKINRINFIRDKSIERILN